MIWWCACRSITCIGLRVGFYHSCPGGEGGDELRLTLKETEKVSTVRVWLRCDCCTERIEGITVWARSSSVFGEETWTQCGEPFGTREDRAKGKDGKLEKCDLRLPAEEQYLERDCGGKSATAVKLVQAEGEDAAPMNIPEMEVYPC